MKKQLSIYLALCLLLVGLSACAPAEPAQTSTVALESSTAAGSSAAREQPVSSAAPASSEEPVGSEPAVTSGGERAADKMLPTYVREADKALQEYSYEEDDFAFYKVDRDYAWWTYMYRPSGFEEATIFMRGLVSSKTRWDEYYASMEGKTPIERQQPSIALMVDFFGIDKEDFIAANNENKLSVGAAHLYGDPIDKKELTKIYTDEQIEAIYSGDKARINRAFVDATALYYEGNAYAWTYIVDWTVEELRETGIPKETLLEFADRTDRWMTVYLEESYHFTPEDPNWEGNNQYRAENGESYTMEQIKEKINQM